MKHFKLLRTQYLNLLRLAPVNAKLNHNVSIASNMFLISGIFILMSALIYMIVNLYRADSIIRVWLPFMIAGVVLVFMSQLINWQFPKIKR